MGLAGGGFAAFVNDAPIIEIKGGVAFVRYGNSGMDRAMSIQTFTRAVERGQRALRKHAAGDEHVLVDD